MLAACGSGDDGSPQSTSQFQPIHAFGTADYHSLAFSPTDAGVVLFGHHGGIQMSRDSGARWDTVIEEQGRDAMNLVYDPLAPQSVYMAGHDVYYKSGDSGMTWQPVESNLPGKDLHAFAVSPAKEGRAYAYAVGYGLFRSEDGGVTWKLQDPSAPQGTNSILVLMDGTLIIGATDQGILRSDDGGITWAQARDGIDVGAIYAIKGNPDGSRLYAGTDNGLYSSTDGGQTWTATAMDNNWVVAIGVNPMDPDEVLVIDRNGELFRSRDAGQTWG